MPELPEVETVARDLAQLIIKKKIHSVHVYDKRVISRFSPIVFAQKLTGKIIKSVSRRAKAIIIAFDSGDYLVVQPKMTGHFVAQQLDSELSSRNPRISQQKNRKSAGFPSEKILSPKENRDIKVMFDFGNNLYVYYLDQRTFGWLIYTKDLKEISYLNTAGPEPLGETSFNVDYLEEKFKSRNGPIKNILLNQQLIAGLGNIYASEILFASRIDPKTPASSLKRPQLKLIYDNTRSILKEAITRRGTSMRNYRDTNGEKGSFIKLIKVYGRDGENCPNCKRVIVRLVQAGRSTFYCPHCQKRKE